MKELIQSYFPLILLIGAVFILGNKIYKDKVSKTEVPRLLEKGGIIVDVRTPAEYNSGHSQKSINIPLSDLPRRLKELPKDHPIILCCASGMRSGQAVGILQKEGFKEVFNAGAWTNTVH